MALSDLLRTCSKNIPGIAPQVFLTPVKKIKSITENSTGEVTKIEFDSASSNITFFKVIEADIDSVQFTAEGEFKTAGAYEQSLILGLSKPRTESVNWVSSLRDEIACGVVAVYWDNNGQGWIYGANAGSKEGLTRPINGLAVSYDTGKEMTDEDSQRIQITLKRMSGYLPSPLLGGGDPGYFLAPGTAIVPTAKS